MAEKTHSLPVGAVVDYTAPETGARGGGFDRARLIVVAYSWDGPEEPLYMLRQHPLVLPDGKYGLYSRVYLAYHLAAGWDASHVPISRLVDTGERVKVLPFQIEPWMLVK